MAGLRCRHLPLHRAGLAWTCPVATSVFEGQLPPFESVEIQLAPGSPERGGHGRLEGSAGQESASQNPQPLVGWHQTPQIRLPPCYSVTQSPPGGPLFVPVCLLPLPGGPSAVLDGGETVRGIGTLAGGGSRVGGQIMFAVSIKYLKQI
ncbi:hypothetical protein C0J52_10944 [Blattella germanica]|nr:hypothetical protein C0J52_10944 [Blattella germanica]